MGQPVVHFEIIGKQPERLRRYYGELFGWEFDTSGTVSPSVSEAGNYGFVDPGRTTEGVGIPGGVGGGSDYDSKVLFYVFVPNVEAALQEAERLGGKRQMGPDQAPGRGLVLATSPIRKAISSEWQPRLNRDGLAEISEGVAPTRERSQAAPDRRLRG